MVIVNAIVRQPQSAVDWKLTCHSRDITNEIIMSYIIYECHKKNHENKYMLILKDEKNTDMQCNDRTVWT